MPFDGNDYPVDLAALGKIDLVIELIGEERFWCKRQLRSYDGRRCILGAMMAADATTTLRVPIMKAITECYGIAGRIESFNDDHKTTHRMVLRVLYRARDNILAAAPVPGARMRHVVPPAAPRCGFFTRLFARAS